MQGCPARAERGCKYTLVRCANCRSIHYTASPIFQVPKQSIIIPWSGRDEWRTMELEIKKASEELTRVEKGEEEVKKG